MAEEPGRESSATDGAGGSGSPERLTGTATLASGPAGVAPSPTLPVDGIAVPTGGLGEPAALPPPAVEAGVEAAALPTGKGFPRTVRRDRRHRTRRRYLWFLLVVLAAVSLSAAGWEGAKRVNHPLDTPAVEAGLPVSLMVTGAPPPLSWPNHGQGAISIPVLGYTAQSGAESPVPIASLTKMANALVILHDHPVPAGADGATVTITAGDVGEYDTELHNDQSTVPIQLGENLTERQMLEALLTQSANDIAYALAVWDAGSVDAFVAKMNAMAIFLGADSTHYVDPSGYGPGSVSTAADCLRIASAGMADPTFAAVVGMATLTLPLMGVVHNVVTEVGSNGVVGVKSGYTSTAGGCMVLAANRVVDGRTVVVLAAVLGQPVPPPTVPPTTTTTTTPPTTTTTTPAAAAPAPVPGAAPPAATPPPTTTTTTPAAAAPAPAPGAPQTTTTTIPRDDLPVPDPFRFTRPAVEGLLSSAEAGVVRLSLTSPGQPAGTVTASWGGQAHRVPVVASGQAWLLGWPGQRASSTTSIQPVPAGGTGGTQVGTAYYRLGGQVESVPLRLASAVPEPSWWWRLIHD
jgi:D-alanyl-D-alanine carboxypeptidase (penicillin-binding protein 5/6)